jgi:hypothetical protein
MRLGIGEGPGIVLATKRALACAKHLFARLPVGCQLYANGAAVTLAPKEHAAPSLTLSFDTYWSAFGPRRKGNSLQACLAKFAGLTGTSCRRQSRVNAVVDRYLVVHNFFKFPRASNLIQVCNFSETPSRPCA